MNIPSRRKLAAAALIIAGLSAFLVPFVLRGPNTQGTGPTNPTNPGGGTNPGGTTNPTSPSSPNPNNGNTGSNQDNGSTGTCDDPSDHGHSQGKQHGQSGKHGKHLGLVKNLGNSAQHMLDKIARHNPAFTEHNSTRTDNDLSPSHGNHGQSSHSDSDCAGDTDEDNDD